MTKLKFQNLFMRYHDPVYTFTNVAELAEFFGGVLWFRYIFRIIVAYLIWFSIYSNTHLYR